MSKQCKIIEDLLPLYHDGVCSEESKQLVEEHLSQCEECSNLLDKIDGEIVSPTKDEEWKLLEGISKAVRKGRKKAFIAGISITLAAVLLLFAGLSTWWYCHEYSYYSAFAEGQTPALVEANMKNGIKPTEIYTWYDDTYQYTVTVPDFLDIGGFAGMSRLDNNETKTIELAITRWDNKKYIFHIFINDADEIRYFIVDDKLNLYGNYSEEQIKTIQEEFNEYKEIVQELMQDAIAMWPFIA